MIIWIFRQNCLCPPNNLDMCHLEWNWSHPSKLYSLQSSLCQLEPASHGFSAPLGKCWDFHWLWFFWAKLSSGRYQNSFITVIGTIPSYFSWKSFQSPVFKGWYCSCPSHTVVRRTEKKFCSMLSPFELQLELATSYSLYTKARNLKIKLSFKWIKFFQALTAFSYLWWHWSYLRCFCFAVILIISDFYNI